MDTSRRQIAPPSLARAAFTLVEMLVSVALVLLMMVMFAEIFSFATASMSKQKGLAELDQRQRLVSSIFRNDLENRSFRNIYPYHSADSSTHIHSANLPSNIPFDARSGYFYISENDPENDNDDVLQFTMTRVDGMVFYGKTKELLDVVGNGVGFNPNQPENDDGTFFSDGLGVGSSPSAEVAYFVRNGILYRRVLLIRRPADSSYIDSPTVPPGDSSSTLLIQPGIYPQAYNPPMGAPLYYVAGGGLNSRYPQDFDYSATNSFGSAGPPVVPPQLTILGESSLTNNSDPLSLGLPQNRFGFQGPVGPGIVGFPKEYVTGGAFIGRFTQEETSHLAFGWPGNPGTGGDSIIATADDSNPYTRSGLTLNANGVVDQYRTDPTNLLSLSTTRQGEDILLTNVQSFDIKVWDPAAYVGPDGQPGIAGVDDDNSDGDNNKSTGADNPGELGWPGSDDGAWSDIGHAGQGFYALSQRLNNNYGPWSAPSLANNRVFDTWHKDLSGTLGRAPFRPALMGYDRQPGVAGDGTAGGYGDDDLDGTDDNIEELGWPNSDDVPILLKAIQIRVRYLDISSRLVREVTIIEYLTPDSM